MLNLIEKRVRDVIDDQHGPTGAASWSPSRLSSFAGCPVPMSIRRGKRDEFVLAEVDVRLAAGL
jgi:hypothetical protein